MSLRQGEVCVQYFRPPCCCRARNGVFPPDAHTLWIASPTHPTPPFVPSKSPASTSIKIQDVLVVYRLTITSIVRSTRFLLRLLMTWEKAMGKVWYGVVYHTTQLYSSKIDIPNCAIKIYSGTTSPAAFQGEGQQWQA